MGASPLTRVPWWTLGLLAIALIAQWVPGVAEALIYDRTAIVHGDAWRLFTGNLVHFSTAHLLANVAVVAPAGWWIESNGRKDVAALSGIAVLAIGIALLVGRPDILEFGGASGIAMAFVVHAGLRALDEGMRARRLGVVVLAAVGAKLLAECAGWQIHDWRTDGFVTVTLSHLTGAATGGIWHLWRVTRATHATPAHEARA